LIVVDANVLIELLVEGPPQEVVRGVMRADPAWAAPLLWRSEFCNFLANEMRRGERELDEALICFEAAHGVVEGREYPVSPERVLRACAASGCTAYDCEYAVLADSLGVPLVTGDRQLLKAFPGLAVTPAAFARGRG
jgi:predicted nucleic acid-binding protein